MPVRGARSDRGSVTALMSVMAIALLMMAGLAYDGGQIVGAHAQARSHAAKAARAGAQEIDITVLRQTGRTVLDPAQAEAAAMAYLEEIGATGTVQVEGDTVTVTITVTQPMRVLPLPDRVIVVTKSADAVPSPTSPDEVSVP